MSDYWMRSLNSRLSRRRALVASGAAGLGAAFLAACGGDSSNTPKDASGLITTPVDTTKQAKRGGVLKRNSNGEGSLDPNLSVGTTSPYLEMIYTRLISWKPGHLKAAAEDQIVGDTAESWEWSPDRLQITMKLRPNVKFHNVPPVNGRALDADDVLFSWKRFAEVSPSRGGIANSANPSAPVLSVTAPDQRTVVIKLAEPISYALSYFGGREQVNMLPKEASNQAVLDLRSNYLGAGPFMLSKFEPSVGFTFKKNPDYWDKDNVYVDQVDYRIIPEYAATLSQLRAGNIYVMGGFGVVAAGSPSVTQEDVVQVKRDVPAIGLYASDITVSRNLRLAFGKRTPAFRDERVRLAFQMSYDRDTWIDTLGNAVEFEKAGLPVERSWMSAFPAIGHGFDGWRLEPRDAKSFGPNAKYYQYDIAEAKRLLAAAGFPNGIDVVSTYPTTTDARTVAAREGMNSQAGIRFKNNPVEINTEFTPKYRDSQGDFEGVAYKGTIVASADPVDRISQTFWSKSGTQFYGFDSAGKGDGSGDPNVDDLLVKARREVDTNKSKALILELERYLAPKAYLSQGLGGATAFTLAWPVIGNFWVWQGAYFTNVLTPNTRWWIDDTKPPVKQG